MKLLDSPRSGRLGAYVYYTTPFGQCCRALTMPRDARSPAQARARASFAACSQAWGRSLTEAQRQRWVAAAQTVPSRPSVGQYGPLSGQQFYVRINSVLDCIGQPPVTEPPAPVVFSPNLVTGLEIVQDPEAGLRLRLNVGVATEDIMVFGQAPCSPGRMKHRRVYYLGLLSPSQNGQSDITELYTARFGQPAPGQKVFIVTSQTRNGWKGPNWVHSAIVPLPSTAKSQQATEKAPVKKAKPASASPSSTARTTVSSSSSQAMYKGSTPEARQERMENKHEPPLSILGTPLVHGLLGAIGWVGRLGRLAAGAGAL